jgi:hypothetical protein
LNLKGSLDALNKPENRLYNGVFVRDLRKKYKRKIPRFPEKMNNDTYQKIKSLLDFDNLYTAPAHGFTNAFDYYEKSSSLPFIPNINVPTLILCAKNDSFLSEDCYPVTLASHSKNIYLEMPKYGGHVGFHKSNKVHYSEIRALQFLTEN